MNEAETEECVLARSTREVHLAPTNGSSHSQVRVKRGFMLTISSGLPRWEVNQRIDRARIASLAQSRDPRIVFVGTSSLCIQGVPLWSSNHDITFWCPQPYPNSTLPPVRYSGFTIPSVKVRKLRRPPLTVFPSPGQRSILLFCRPQIDPPQTSVFTADKSALT